MSLVPFYWKEHPDFFAIERAAMDKPDKVIEKLDQLLPNGLLLDVGAGDGFTAAALTRRDRLVVALEPVYEMVKGYRGPRVAGDVEHLPFTDSSFAAVYSTWAYFFPYFHEITRGLQEAVRVLGGSGLVVVADNIGGDEFSALSGRQITVDPTYWTNLGFELTEIDTTFEFESIEDAKRLLHFYFGEQGVEGAKLSLSYRVGLFVADREAILI